MPHASITATETITLPKVFEAIGQVQGRLDGIQDHLSHIDAATSLSNIAVQEIATKVALHEHTITRHEKRISEMLRRLDITDVTGRIHITEERTRWKTLHVLAAILVGMGVLASSIFGLHTLCSPQHSAIKTAPLPAK